MSAGELLAHRVEGEGEPLLLLNGGLMSYAAWEPVGGRLRGRHRLVLCDLRGQLLSPGRAPRELAGNIADLTELLDHLEVETAHVVGASYGGEIALLLAATAPERVRSLVVVTAADHAGPEMSREGQIWRRLVAASGDANGRARFYERLVAEVYSGEFRRRHAAELEARRDQVAALPESWWRGLESILRALEGFDVRPWLGAIRAPTLVAVAAGDRLIPPERSLALASAIAGAETRVHQTSGHALVAEDPEWLAEAVLDFLGRQSTGGLGVRGAPAGSEP